jgi:putative N-acetylmannosamine-6-phosphate epimerase
VRDLNGKLVNEIKKSKVKILAVTETKRKRDKDIRKWIHNFAQKHQEPKLE